MSWRVHILPYLEQQALYNEFHLDEPWDSEHNKKLIAKMPAVYAEPTSRFAQTEGRTNYLGVKGKKSVFRDKEQGMSLREITDGTSNTLMVLQVNDQRATPWTKPDDWEPDAKKILDGLRGSLHPGIFLAPFAMGRSVHLANLSIPVFLKHFSPPRVEKRYKFLDIVALGLVIACGQQA